MAPRYAIYYAPDVSDPLWARANQWLGRDPVTGSMVREPIPPLGREELDGLTVSARRYGFHATIKAPMALASDASEAELQDALARFAAEHAPLYLGRLELVSLHGFLALIPQANEALQDLAAHVVESFEPFRAPLSLKDQARRAAAGLTPRQQELLGAYGYPYVFEEFQFHMTLTDRLGKADHDRVLAAAEAWFAPVLATSVRLDRICLFVEPSPGEPFRRATEYRLRDGALGV
ncbi:DUF1045 domain-containing protein [Devosia sp. 1566]|uniref:DUF1045 domain-containing protein n=1 Tax=Devosia sp. 1566 TaxID=2499144 RepID=UPI000FDC73F4|nr:DUF1045 domain-containing protein [Devosia sp. 1566]